MSLEVGEASATLKEIQYSEDQVRVLLLSACFITEAVFEQAFSRWSIKNIVGGSEVQVILNYRVSLRPA